MATPSLKLRLHVLGSKIHKWLAIFVGVQVLLWMGTGALMSFLDLEEVRSEHVVSREQEALPADAPLPAWVANDGTLAAVTTRSLDGDAVTEVRKVDGSVSLHDPVTGRKLPPHLGCDGKIHRLARMDRTAHDDRRRAARSRTGGNRVSRTISGLAGHLC